ncbi:MAG: hypothetical protein U0271_38630 [Polyangiaceae bacterium]
MAGWFVDARPGRVELCVMFGGRPFYDLQLESGIVILDVIPDANP